MAKCRHKTKIILASANGPIDFVPDEEPYKSGVIESTGIEAIVVNSVDIHYCPRCEQIVDIWVDDSHIEEIPS